MKILHLPFTYYPDPVGGTEVYVEGLVRHLERLGVAGVIAAPADQEDAAQYEFHGHTVHRFPVPPPKDISELYGDGSPAAAAAVRRVIDAEHPDVVHMHAYTRGVSVLLAREVTAAGLPLVFTYHTPTVSCQRGSLLRYGRIPCDGKVLVTRCSACIAQKQGAGRASWLFALLPPFIGSLLRAAGMQGRRWAAFRLTDLLRRRKQAFHELASRASAVVSPSEWVTEVLKLNGVAPHDIVLSRQGTESDRPPSARPRREAGRPLRAIMLGRLHSNKGLDVLLEALALVPTLQIQIDVYGIDQDAGAAPADRLRRLADREPRVTLLPPFSSAESARVIAGYDVTLVPSRWLETGPLVVLESFAAGVPVVGSRLGGIAERVRHDVDGLLVPQGDSAAWAAALVRLVEDERLLPKLIAGIRPPKSIEQVAIEMRDLYLRLVAAPSTQGVRAGSRALVQ